MTDDSFLNTYVDECNEHLMTVENDLISMERSGSDIDQDLVNRVFRAAHSIKGGAGFFELSSIKELAHKLENVLDMIRKGTLTPNPEVVNQLLNGFDKLGAMVNDIEHIDSMDISDEIVSLTGLAASYLPSDRKSEAAAVKRFAVPASECVLEAGVMMTESARDAGNGIAILRFDLIHDVHRLGKTPLDIIKTLDTNGIVLDCAVDVAGVGDLESETIANNLPFYLLYATKRSVVEIATSMDLPMTGITFLELPKPPEAKRPETKAEKKDGDEAEPAEQPRRQNEAASKTAVAQKDSASSTDSGTSKQSGGSRETSRSPAAQAAPAESRNGKTPHHDEGDSTVRISVSVLDTLMNYASELVLSRNELLEAIRSSQEKKIAKAGKRIDLVTRSMQEAVMLTRMQPVGNLFSRFPRLVRDVSRDMGKEIELRMTGREVEIDKTILEMLSDPLTHLVRNACDHGVEDPDARVAAGKTTTATVSLSARHETGKIVIEVRDDGRGIDVEAVASKAVSMGLISAERVKFMSEKEKAALILLPGLSTAKKLTEISGRGVGMDVVKTNIDQLGGQMEITSSRGLGTTFTVRLPLTLAIVPSLLVSAGSGRYAISEANVEELLQVRASDIKNRVEKVGGEAVLVLRGLLLPLIRLTDVLDLPRTVRNPETDEEFEDRRANIADRRSGVKRKLDSELRESEDRRFHAASDYTIVVVNSAALRYAIVVDGLHDTMEIVVKPLGSHFSSLREFSGATILGDGSTALIVDTTGLATRAGLVSVARNEMAETYDKHVEKEKGPETESQAFLLFHNVGDEEFAAPLESVIRVLRLSRQELQHVGKLRVFTYQGKAVPLFTMREAVDAGDPLEGKGELVCVLVKASEKIFGIVATPPIDSFSTEKVPDTGTLSKGAFKGTILLKDKNLVVVDVEAMAKTVMPSWFGLEPESHRVPQAQAQSQPQKASAGRILVTDDSDFFRAKIVAILTEAGYEALQAADGDEALNVFAAKGKDLDMIITDLEMPEMNGFELTKNIRASGSKIPIIALSSLASEEDEAKGFKSGIDAFQVKLDPESLLSNVKELLKTRI